MKYDFDLLVIGTGTAGGGAATKLRQAGWKVAIAENRLAGGACALRACDPKKVLLSAAEGLDWVHRLQGKGLVADNAHICWPDLMRFKRSFTEKVPKNTEAKYEEAGIVLLKGNAQFTGPQSVEVAGKAYTADKILIATGSVPAPLSFDGSEYLVNSDYFLDMDELPARIIFIGGGYISFELGHLSARAGAQVRIIEQGSRPLKQFDPDLTDQLLVASQEIGIDVRLNTTIEALEKKADGYCLYVSTDAGQYTLEADLVVHGAGRVPNVRALDLPKANVEVNPAGGVRVNDGLQSESNPRVYAAGDAIGEFPALTPVAGLHARMLTQNWLQQQTQKADYRSIPSVIFTNPMMASVGWQEKEAKDRGIDFRVAYVRMADWFAHRRIGEKYASCKTLTDARTGEILGVHLLGHHSDELINLFTIAIRAKLTAKDLGEIIYAYPTHGSNVVNMLP